MALILIILLLTLHSPPAYSSESNTLDIQGELSSLSKKLGNLSIALNKLKQSLTSLHNKLLGKEDDKSSIKKYLETGDKLDKDRIKDAILLDISNKAIEAENIFNDISTAPESFQALIKDNNILDEALIKSTQGKLFNINKISTLVKKFKSYFNQNENYYDKILTSLASNSSCNAKDLLYFINTIETDYPNHLTLQSENLSYIIELFGKTVEPQIDQEKSCSDIIIEFCSALHKTYQNKNITYSYALLGLAQNSHAKADDIKKTTQWIIDLYESYDEKKSIIEEEIYRENEKSFTVTLILLHYADRQDRTPQDVAEIINFFYKKAEKTETVEETFSKEDPQLISENLKSALPSILMKFAEHQKRGVNEITTLLKAINSDHLTYASSTSSLNNRGLFILEFAKATFSSGEQVANLIINNKPYPWTNKEKFILLGPSSALCNYPILYIIDNMLMSAKNSEDDIILTIIDKTITVIELLKVSFHKEVQEELYEDGPNIFEHIISEALPSLLSNGDYDPDNSELNKKFDILLTTIKRLDALFPLEKRFVDKSIISLAKELSLPSIPSKIYITQKLNLKELFNNYTSQDFSTTNIAEAINNKN